MCHPISAVTIQAAVSQGGLVMAAALIYLCHRVVGRIKMQTLEIKGIQVSVSETYLIKYSYKRHWILILSSPGVETWMGKIGTDNSTSWRKPYISICHSNSTFLIKDKSIIQLRKTLLDTNTKETVLMCTINLQHMSSARIFLLIVTGNYFQKPEVPSMWVKTH